MCFLPSARSSFCAATGSPIPEALWHTPRIVYCKPVVQGPDKVLDYLARYIYRVAITNQRILSIDDGKVTFRYKDSSEHRWKTMILACVSFVPLPSRKAHSPPIRPCNPPQKVHNRP